MSRVSGAGCWVPVPVLGACAGCWVLCAGCMFRVLCAECRLSGTGCWVSGAGCRVLGAGCMFWIPGAVCRVPVVGCRVLDVRCWVLGAVCRVPSAGCRVLGVRCWVPGAGCWVLGAGCWVPTAEVRVLHTGGRHNRRGRCIRTGSSGTMTLAVQTNKLHLGGDSAAAAAAGHAGWPLPKLVRRERQSWSMIKTNLSGLQQSTRSGRGGGGGGGGKEDGELALSASDSCQGEGGVLSTILLTGRWSGGRGAEWR